jgi:hypothetical protein
VSDGGQSTMGADALAAMFGHLARHGTVKDFSATIRDKKTLMTS